jgi:hypothetical protein
MDGVLKASSFISTNHSVSTGVKVGGAYGWIHHFC